MEFDFAECIRSGVDQAMRECELTIGMTLKEAVEKQIPKKPVIPWDSMSGDYVCPICLSGFLGNQLYCSSCGQAIDWSEDE